MRQIVLDTETTGLEVGLGHRIIEIGCVEMIDRKLTGNHYHQYIKPQRAIDEGALAVHGITPEFLQDKPVFKGVWQAFFDYVDGAELIIHNAAFDIGFINAEMRLMSASLGKLTDYCGVLDSLELARQKHPGQKNNLDALCKRYMVDNSQRELHGALLDAEILADVYLLLTGGQVTLSFDTELTDTDESGATDIKRINANRPALKVVKADMDELQRHELKLDQLDKASAGAVWRRPD
ncbi:MAG: DNA polymerase III subunit epsilon [Pseudomonadales bacterium]|nr:DNA polymerase III subunit epsilon [Pseudomonadales bacterium]